MIQKDIRMETYKDPESEDANMRLWEFEGYIIPCGGIHVDFLQEIGNVEVQTSHKKKTNTFKITLKD